MKKIKFRGKEIKSNKYVYGFFIRCIDDCVILTAEGLKTVYPESVAQLVELDADNKEVYEGDILVDAEGHEYIATLDAMLLWTKDPALKYWHLPFNLDKSEDDEKDDEPAPKKLLWEFVKNCIVCDKKFIVHNFIKFCSLKSKE